MLKPVRIKLTTGYNRLAAIDGGTPLIHKLPLLSELPSYYSYQNNNYMKSRNFTQATNLSNTRSNEQRNTFPIAFGLQRVKVKLLMFLPIC
jgi:hypothetical protein